MPSKGADIEGGARGTRDSIGREQADKDRAREAATKAKQADLQGFGATPPGSEPSQAEIDSLGDAIDRLNRESIGLSGFLNDVFGIKQDVRQNPQTGEYDVWSGKSISPTRIGIGVAANALGGPVAGKVADFGLDQIGFDDPLGFDIGGFAKDRTNKDYDADQRDGERQNMQNPVASLAPQTPAGNQDSPAVNSIDKFVENLLKQFETTVFPMPDFKLLDPQFGKNVQSEELQKIFDGLLGKKQGAN